MDENILQKRVAYLEEANQKILFSLEAVRSLINFQGEMNIEHDFDTICKQGIDHILRFINFETAAFFLFSDDLIDVTLAYAHPRNLGNEAQNEVDQQIKNGTFAWTIRQKIPVIIQPLILRKDREILFHSLATKSRVLGMFFGQLARKRDRIHQENLDLLSIALSHISLGMENAMLYQEVKANNIALERKVEERTCQLKEAKEQAETASRIKSEFLANMSHEIRTPLNSVIAFSDMLYEMPLNEEQKDFCDSIRTSSRSLLDLIGDILDFSKIESGKLDLEEIDFDLFCEIRGIIKTMSLDANRKGLDLICNFSKDIIPFVKGDPGRLRQILVNLIGNAIKFTNKGKVVIESNRVSEKEGGSDSGQTLFFAVRDTGCGIPKVMQEIIFESFRQADGSITRKYGGTGLGLSISSRLAEMMGGELKIKSPPDGQDTGCEFFFSLYMPFAENPSELERALKTDPEEHRLEDGKKQAFKILLVEDTPMNVKVATKLLGNLGHTVFVAENGRLAVEAVKRNRFDLILMDIQMPVMDGLEATKEIRLNGYEIPIIAMTANAMKEDKEKCLAAGMDSYVSKPIEIKKMGPLLQNVVQKKSKPYIKYPLKKMQTVKIEPCIQVQDIPIDRKMTSITDVETKKMDVKDFPETLPGINIPEALERLGGNRELYDEMLYEFSQDNDDTVQEIRDSLKKNDMKLARRIAHTLKGTAASISANALQASAAELEMAIQYETPDRIEHFIDDIENPLNQVLESIRTLDRAVTGREVSERNRDIAQMDGDPDPDKARIMTTISKLAEYLKEYDPMRSKGCLDSIKEFFDGSELSDHLKIIENNINDFDFDEARKHLRIIGDNL